MDGVWTVGVCTWEMAAAQSWVKPGIICHISSSLDTLLNTRVTFNEGRDHQLNKQIPWWRRGRRRMWTRAQSHNAVLVNWLYSLGGLFPIHSEEKGERSIMVVWRPVQDLPNTNPACRNRRGIPPRKTKSHSFFSTKQLHLCLLGDDLDSSFRDAGGWIRWPLNRWSARIQRL